MHSTRFHRLSLPTRVAAGPAPCAATVAALAVLVGTVAAAVPAPAAAAVFADVVSSTPVTAFVPVQRRQCGPGTTRSTDPAVVDGDSQPAGATESASGCRTVTVRTQRVVGYDVVYAIGGERHTVRLDRDPGSRVELGVVAQAPSSAGRPVGRLAAPPVERVDRTERPIGQPVPVVVDDGGAVAAPVYGYGEQAPIGARPAGSTTVIVERGGWYDPYPYGYGYGPGLGYGHGYGYGYGYAPGWYGPSIGIGFRGGHWGGGWGGHRRWDGGHRPGPPKDKFPHRVGGGPNARR